MLAAGTASRLPAACLIAEMGVLDGDAVHAAAAAGAGAKKVLAAGTASGCQWSCRSLCRGRLAAIRCR